MPYFVDQNGVAVNRQQTLVVGLQLLSLLFRLMSYIPCITTLLSWYHRLLELFVHDECEGWEFTDGLIRITRSHIIVRCVFTLIIIDEVEGVALGCIRILKRARLM